MKVEFATIRAARAFYAARRLNCNWPVSLAVACCGYASEIYVATVQGPECVFGALT